MNDQFKAQKEILVSLKHEISLLHQQVDYLIRNEKSLGLLDLDVMMNRTHTIYDQLCSINVGNPPADNDEVDIDPEMLNALFGMDDEEEEYYEDPDEEAETPVQEEVTIEKIADTPEENDNLPEGNDNVEEKEETEDTGEIIDSEEKDDAEMIDTEGNVDFEESEDIEEEKAEEIIANKEKEEDSVIEEEPVKETAPTEEQDYGFIFRLEPDEPDQPNLFSEPEQPTPEEKKTGFYTTGDEIEMEIPHFDFPTTEDDDTETSDVEEEPITPEEEEPGLFEDIIPIQEDENGLMEEENDFIDEEENEPFEENADSPKEELEIFEETEPLEETETLEETDSLEETETFEETDSFEETQTPEEEELEPQEETPEEEQDSSDDIAYEPIIFGNMEEKDDLGFEFEPVETLGDKLQHEDDNTVAAMLQNQATHNLRSAIGINDKFLFVNELFGGSMEKYNRSIGNLDDLKTLNGALIYLNELRIELQWNSNNEAYKKLLEMVHQKFE